MKRADSRLGGPTSVLVVTGGPDDRPSTAGLRRLVHEMEQRPDVAAHVWHLRAYEPDSPWPGALVVDDLRTTGISGLLSRLRVPIIAAAARGRRLRRWLSDAAPDLVILDDGLGMRALPDLPPTTCVAVRVNPVPPDERYAEQPVAPSRCDLVITDLHLDLDRPPGTTVYVSQHADVRDPGTFVSEEALATARRRLGVPDDAALVVGWGHDGWLDGPDVFIRCLWAMEHRHGIAAHGRWIAGGQIHDHEVDRLVAEAQRCGLGDRYQLTTDDRPEHRLCGDVVMFAARSGTSLEEMRTTVVSGLTAAAFPVHEFLDPSITVVDHLDVDSAAAALVAGLRGRRSDRAAVAADRLDVRRCVDRLLVAAGGER